MNNIRDQKLIDAFGRHLRQIRLQHGLTQEQLADRVGISANQISRIEIGAINTTISTAKGIAKALDISLSKLFDADL